MGHYFENTSLTGVAHFLDTIKNELVTEGWTANHLNTTTTFPAEDHVGASYLFISNGKTGSVGDLPAHHGVWMGWAQASAGSQIAYGVFSGHKRVPTGSIVKASNTVTVNATNHGLRVGDVLLVMKTGNSDFHSGWPQDDSPLEVSEVPNANSFRYTDTANTANISPTTFEDIYAIYNSGGTFTAREGNINFGLGNFAGQAGGQLSPTSLDVFGYADEYAVSGLLVFGSVFRYFYLGLTGRGHVPDSWQHVGRLVSNVTGTGSPQVLHLDRNCPNMSIGQPIWLVPPNDSDGQKNDDQNSVSRGSPDGTFLTASAKPTDSSVTVTLRSGDAYPPGTLVGFDPSPMLVVGLNATVTNQMDNHLANTPISYDGTVAKGNTGSGSYEFDNSFIRPMVLGSNTTNFDDELAPVSNIHTGYEACVVGNAAANILPGMRYPLRGVTGWGHGLQNDQDLMVVGEDIAANRYKIFTSIRWHNAPSPSAGVFDVGIGPGAS